MARHSRPKKNRLPHRPSRPSGPWVHGPIPVIGVVGGIGSGKSAVSEMLAALGAAVIDADAVGHALLDQKPVRERVVGRFGPDVLRPPAFGDDPESPAVDRRVLGARVFSDEKALKDLEAILHPRMRRTFEKAIARFARRGKETAVVIDAAILFEAGWNDLCDRVLFVDAPRDQRLARLSEGRGWNEDVLSARERAQAPLEDKKERADLVVVNDGDLDALRVSVSRAWQAAVDPRSARRVSASRPPSRAAAPVPTPRPRRLSPGDGRSRRGFGPGR